MSIRRGKVVFTAGVWDMLHVGHVRLLVRAKSLGTKLIVGVLTDDAAAAYKPRPIISFEERMELVGALKVVDAVEPVYNTNATYLLRQLKPDVLVHGDDLLKNPKWEIGQSWMKHQGRDIVLLPYTKDTSTTQIVDKVIHARGKRL
jgi:glycerol-3-phosphate cytidylyltransferase